MIAFPANQDFRNQRPGGRALGAQTGPHVVAKWPRPAKGISQLASQQIDQFAIDRSRDCDDSSLGQGSFAMLICWIVLAFGQLSAPDLPLVDVTSNVTSSATGPTSPAI